LENAGSGFRLFGLGLGWGLDDGFVWQFFAEGFEAVEFLDGSAVVAFSLGLVAQQ
jgi:hypothetical protein